MQLCTCDETGLHETSSLMRDSIVNYCDNNSCNTIVIVIYGHVINLTNFITFWLTEMSNNFSGERKRRNNKEEEETRIYTRISSQKTNHPWNLKKTGTY